jgi:hypothetical protein
MLFVLSAGEGDLREMRRAAPLSEGPYRRNQ